MVEITDSDYARFSNIPINSLLQKKEFYIKGSESFIYKGICFTKKVLIKERRPKIYRDKRLDNELRLQRLKIESKMIKSALNSNINVPSLISVNLNDYSLVLEEINGNNLGFLLNEPNFNSNNSSKTEILQKFGQIVAYLHNIEIIHGDLTPLNILIANENQIFIIDFGLAFYSNEVKDKSMDLFILYGALKIYSDYETLFQTFLQGYNAAKDFSMVLDNFNKLTQKGRYK